MKLVRFGAAGNEKPGILDEAGTIRDLSAIIDDFTPERMTEDLRSRLASVDPGTLPAVEAGVRFGPPVKTTGHFIAIGLNYVDHAIESGLEPPNEPVVFSKAPSCIVGPDDDVVVPKGSTKLDWEVELGFVIGKRALYISEAEALSHIFGYMVCNDVSERAFQIEGTGQWIKGKSAPTFGPLGPWLVTADEIGDPQNLDLWLDVNGTRRQTGNTRTMIFGVAHLVAYLSQVMILEPGDIVITGTPPGVGMGQKPPTYLKPGDEIRLGIEGLGEQHQRVVACTE